MRYTSLQFFRGLAAFGVVLVHTSLSVNAIVAPIPHWLDAVMSRGYLGVDFFFVLSGFIILSAHRQDAQTAKAFWDYAVKRFLRVFPPYWPIGVLMLVAYAVVPKVSLSSRDISTLSSLTLLPARGAPALPVAWTLIHEVLFYAIFSVFFVSPRLLGGLVFAWVLAILTLTPVGPCTARLLSPLNLSFVMGMGVALIPWRRYGWALIETGAVLLVCAVEVFGESRPLSGLAFALMVWGAVSLPTRLAFPTALGDASYALYLVHNPLISVTSRIARIHPTWWFGMIAIPASIAAGFAYHWLVEKPAIRLFRRGLRHVTA